MIHKITLNVSEKLDAELQSIQEITGMNRGELIGAAIRELLRSVKENPDKWKSQKKEPEKKEPEKKKPEKKKAPEQWQLALQQCNEIQSLCDDLPDAACDFAISVSEGVQEMAEWIEENKHVTDEQLRALDNWQSGCERWVR